MQPAKPDSVSWRVVLSEAQAGSLESLECVWERPRDWSYQQILIKSLKLSAVIHFFVISGTLHLFWPDNTDTHMHTGDVNRRAITPTYTQTTNNLPWVLNSAHAIREVTTYNIGKCSYTCLYGIVKSKNEKNLSVLLTETPFVNAERPFSNNSSLSNPGCT